jgi:hypothetical protein
MENCFGDKTLSFRLLLADYLAQYFTNINIYRAQFDTSPAAAAAYHSELFRLVFELVHHALAEAHGLFRSRVVAVTHLGEIGKLTGVAAAEALYFMPFGLILNIEA